MSDNKSTAWSLTINNPTADDHAALDVARSKGWRVEGQLEKGAEGTPHLQLLLRTPHIRFGAVKKVFPRAHIEPARNVKALEQYVHKDETRQGELPPASQFYPSMNKYQRLVMRELCNPLYDDKDGLDCYELEQGVIRWYRDEDPVRNPERWLSILDQATRRLVATGYHVEQYAVNPAFRSSWKKFAPEMLQRALAECVAEDADAAAAAAAEKELTAEVPTVENASLSPQVLPQAPPPPPPPCPTHGHGSSCSRWDHASRAYWFVCQQV